MVAYDYNYVTKGDVIMRKLFLVLMLCSGLAVLSACGGGSSSSSNDSTDGVQDNTVSGVVVDPYIEGARFCIDENDNFECDPGEELSGYSNANGVFTFDVEPADGDIIVMETAGEHNGVPYSFEGLMGKYENGELIVSPLTTMYAAGLTKTQIVEMLDFAGLEDVTVNSVATDPMDGLMNGDTVNAANLALLRSSIASYMFMKIIDGSDIISELSPAAIYASGMDNTGAVYTILSNMATVLNSVLSANTLATLQTYDDQLVNLGMDPVVFEDVVQVAVAIADRISEIGYTACNTSAGNTEAEHVQDAMNAVNTFITVTTDFDAMIDQLGPAYYLTRVKSGMSQQIRDGVAQADPAWGGFLNCASGAFYVDANGDAACYAGN